MRYKIDRKRFTVADLILFEGGASSTAERRDMLARFLVADNGDYVAEPVARKIINKLTIDEFASALDEFYKSLKEWSEQEVINPPTAAS